jgi:hypothetical protein
VQAADDSGDRQRFVLGGDDDRDSSGISQTRFFVVFDLFVPFVTRLRNGS